MIIEVTESIFESEINTDIPVLMDFYSDWCVACATMHPILDELSEEYQGRVKFMQVNTPENKSISRKYRVMGLPTIVILKNNEVVKVLNGFKPKDVLIKEINDAI